MKKERENEMVKEKRKKEKGQTRNRDGETKPQEFTVENKFTMQYNNY